MGFRAKLLALAVLIFAGLAITFSNPALAGQEAFEKSGGPVDTWNRPIEKAFVVGKDINPVNFVIGVAIAMILLLVARSTFAKFLPLGLVRALTSIGIIVIIWEMVVYYKLVNQVLLPPPTTVIIKLQGHWAKGYLQIHILASLKRLFFAFFLAIVTGVPLGFLIANFRKFSDYVDPLFNLMRVVPPPAWLPFAILWFGIGNPPSYFIIWLGAFFPILLNTISGIKDTQQIHIESIQTLGGSRMDIYTRVMIPSAFPTIFTGIRIGFGIGWICLVTAELVAVDAGLGWMIEDARNLLDTPTVLGGMVVIMMFGIFFDTIFRAAEKEVVKWQ
ncbi:Alkanesulfonates transport system permease protein [hydrothermal vent metagenome]|uniref:Alkanesulfonates transport system permease protein n=1 Tax=hydrothermal vent metagenome TaxID=652676 RepID=A0A3B1C0F0_9ZZZZ